MSRQRAGNEFYAKKMFQTTLAFGNSNKAFWNQKEIYITKNGCAASDELAPDGNTYDSDRVMYLRTAWHSCKERVHKACPSRATWRGA